MSSVLRRLRKLEGLLDDPSGLTPHPHLPALARLWIIGGDKGRSSLKAITITIIGLLLVIPPAALSDDRDAAVRTTIQAFYKAFDDGFTGPADYATEDWNHINPYGGRDRGREATLKDVRAVHQSFLKGTTDTIENMDIRFAGGDV